MNINIIIAISQSGMERKNGKGKMLNPTAVLDKRQNSNETGWN